MEPKVPTDPVSAPSTAGGYVTSAMNWVTGSILGGKDAAAKPTGATGPAEQSSEPPKSVSSQNVNRVVPSLPTVELSMEQLEAMGKKEEKPSLEHADSVEDMWAEKPTVAKKEDDWGEGEWSEEEEEKEEDESDEETPIYNPLNLPLGWDGKPIPYWLYKLYGLGEEFKCEICGNHSYWGRRAFDNHFQEWRHHNGMRCLGIPNTKHFHDITKIEDAKNRSGGGRA